MEFRRPGRLLLLALFMCQDVLSNWDDWWTYEGISGPAYWGMFNPEWHFCDRGRRQSPINIDPYNLLYDPLMPVLRIDKTLMRGRLLNTGRLLTFRVEESDAFPAVNVSGGPLVYSYKLAEIHVHFGINNRTGSEHKIHGNTYPVEVQLYGFNAHLYGSLKEASRSPQGTMAIAIMAKIGRNTSDEMSQFTNCLPEVQYKGSWCEFELSVEKLIPPAAAFMTYEGSTTQPGCWETTTWIVINKPIYITPAELRSLQALVQGSRNETKGLLGNNLRPIQPLHHRAVRTNINFHNSQQEWCPSMRQEMFYKANSVEP